MHELSIAMSIVELVGEEARKAGSSTVTRVEVEIGTLAGVETDALLFAWESAREGSLASQAPLAILTIQAEASCLDCGKVFAAEHFFVQCPNCGSFRYQIVKGKELRVSSLLVE